ncbi:MAG TPA: type ISP restriction/modification enzyme [Elusimicrobiota bacterium]|nr:type ISP restriction/modification enzyme [Elusimicrobiota bacterium]
MTIHDILEEFRREASSNRELGDKFERLVAGYLKTDPLYQAKYSDIWLWTEWPERSKRPDTGIDIVAKERETGGYCAIQCKFFDPAHNLQKSDIDSFFTSSGKEPFTSRLIVSTTDNWSANAEDALNNQRIPVSRLRVQDLAESPVDWSRFSLNRPQSFKLKERKKILPHQESAIKDIIAGFKTADRGKLIMACGTGKTFTALKLAERMVPLGGHVLYLMPSISLVSQTLREWTAEADKPLRSYIVCSDIKVGKKFESEDISVHDLAFPATTNAAKLANQVKAFADKKRLAVIFSTYQSIKVVSEAQAKGAPAFDLIICDEAHRTTGVTLEGEDESHFVRVHSQDFIKAKKRLYMTATPRIYGDGAKTQAKEKDALLCSMDDAELYGPEFHRLGFSESVRNDLLSDYKVMVLAVDEKFVSRTFQSQLADKNNEINLEDAVKITGCWNGLSKRMAKDPTGYIADDITVPMRRAVAFSRSIRDSKRIKDLFAAVIEQYRKMETSDDGMLSCEVEHVDGTFNALKRNEKLDWLKADLDPENNVCRILSNARCLSEGVDVPALDAVLFLNPRNSVVDVVQSVGRVMRKAPGKKYGYIILPVGIPADVPPEEALKDNQRYKVVWQVLQALRAHDDRFSATINKIDLNKTRPDQIQIIGIGGGAKGDGSGTSDVKPAQLVFNFPQIEEWRNAIYAKIVLKCGERQYWEKWAQDVAQIAERHVTRIKALLDGPKNKKHREAFAGFLKGLQKNLNPSIDESAAVEMLSQHLITRPVFDALFEGYEFTKHNPVSLSMQKMLDLLEDQALGKETAGLEKFYASVKERASGVDTQEGRQRIVIELYEKFFQAAFPRMKERLGIVYTPVEVVDFIIHSVNDALRQEFNVSLSDQDVHILDPFTGTGTFMVRLLQSGLISSKDLTRKYESELHANEIVLLAYYIAAINIEEAYHSITQEKYQSFEGIVLTDTFQLTEAGGPQTETTFQENNKRVSRQNKTDIRVIIGNPPYSAGQTSENDANKNFKYPTLDTRIETTYAASSSAGLKKTLYDSYIRSIRWASDRIKDTGIICFVSNGSFIDGNAADGLRKCLADEFSSIYCFNLRGNQRTSGEISRMEGGKIFGSGSRASIAITLLIKNPKKDKCRLYYHDIGDYLSREEKLKIIRDFRSFKQVSWKAITPNKSHDWINQRDPAFERFIPMGDKAKEEKQIPLWSLYSLGVVTNRDAWAYSFSKKNLTANMRRMIDFYNQQATGYKKAISKGKAVKVEDFIDNDSKKISWTRSLKNDLSKGKQYEFNADSIVQGMYRPYCKQWIYFNRRFNEMVYLMPSIFPNESLQNLVITASGIGASKGFSALMTDAVPNLDLHDKCQCFPLFSYEKSEDLGELFAAHAKSNGYFKKDAINDDILTLFGKTYDGKIIKEDIFYYVYGILHSPEYKRRFESDLKKMLPRIPLAKDFWAFSKAGRALAQWHLNYETVEPYPLKESDDALRLEPKRHYRVEKMRFAKQGKDEDKTAIIYNSHLTLEGIPLEACEYVVNGKPALEWIMERYQVTTDKDSGIVNDPNDWSDDPRYILDLVKRIVRVSLETMKIVKSLPVISEL